MTVWILGVIIVVLLAINIALWKFGFVQEAENPSVVEDRPVMNPRERKAILKRLERWREEGKLSREELEKLLGLCESDWG